MGKTMKRAKKKEGFVKSNNSMNPDRSMDKVNKYTFLSDTTIYFSLIFTKAILFFTFLYSVYV